MAIRAALTMYLVFSTIHTNSAMGTISRLLDMGIPSYLVANTLNLSMAQRLARLLRPHCEKEEIFDASLLPKALQSATIMYFFFHNPFNFQLYQRKHNFDELKRRKFS